MSKENPIINEMVDCLNTKEYPMSKIEAIKFLRPLYPKASLNLTVAAYGKWINKHKGINQEELLKVLGDHLQISVDKGVDADGDYISVELYWSDNQPYEYPTLICKSEKEYL